MKDTINLSNNSVLLCDCFIIDHTICKKLEKYILPDKGTLVFKAVRSDFFNLKNESAELIYPDKWENIYGAIWEEGPHGEPILRTIAKMNKNGQLILLNKRTGVK